MTFLYNILQLNTIHCDVGLYLINLSTAVNMFHYDNKMLTHIHGQ